MEGSHFHNFLQGKKDLQDEKVRYTALIGQGVSSFLPLMKEPERKLQREEDLVWLMVSGVGFHRWFTPLIWP